MYSMIPLICVIQSEELLQLKPLWIEKFMFTQGLNLVVCVK